MNIKLTKKPKNSIIIEGFPGFGLVGTIATEFLIEHLEAKQIGTIELEEVPPVTAIHDSNVVDPLGIFYDKKHNIIILHALTSVTGVEWKLADIIAKLAKDIKAKEIISLEGVGGGDLPTEVKKVNAYYFTSNKKDGFKKTGFKPLKEGIIMGVTGALLLKKEGLNLSCVFAETHSSLPDSRAAAKAIEVLDQYLGLKVDYKPLIKKAEVFESKIKGLLEKSKDVSAIKQQKELSYLG